MIGQAPSEKHEVHSMAPDGGRQVERGTCGMSLDQVQRSVVQRSVTRFTDMIQSSVIQPA